MNTPISIKNIAVCLLGMLAAAPLAEAAVSQEVIEFVQSKTEVRRVDPRGKEVRQRDRVKNASRKGRWISNCAKFTDYAQIRRDDPCNRILCTQEFTYNKEVIFEGGSKSEIQLVRIHADEEERIIEAEEVDEIDEEAGGVYVLFTPDVIYVLNYDAIDPKTGEPEPVFRKYENRQ